MSARIIRFLLSLSLSVGLGVVDVEAQPTPELEPLTVNIHIDRADQDQTNDVIAPELLEPLKAQLHGHNIRVQVITGVVEKSYALWLVDNPISQGNHIYSVGTGLNILIDLPQSSLLREEFVEIITGAGVGHHETLAMYLTGVVLYTLDRCDEALTYLEALDHQDKDQTNTPVFLNDSIAFFSGVCAIRREDYGEAVQQLERVVYERDIDERSESAVINLAWLYLHSDRDAEAFALLDDYMGEISEPDDQAPVTLTVSQSDRLVIRAEFHALNADFDAALKDMDTAIAFASTYLASLDMLAELYEERGQIRLLTYEWDAVLADYNAAIEAVPNYAEAYYRRGLLYYTTLVDRENALPDFERYLELAPDGEFAADAAQYITDIQAELEALEK